VLGACLRLARLDLVEFKGDEVEALNLGIRLLENPPWTATGELPRHGMPSSQGIANAPLFNWIMAGAWALTGHPMGATALFGTANALALYPLWRWALTRVDPERALLLVATVAVSPFSVLLSRKLWAQDLLFPALVCLLWAIEYWQTGRMFRAHRARVVSAGRRARLRGQPRRVARPLAWSHPLHAAAVRAALRAGRPARGVLDPVSAVPMDGPG
jgi:hypothetical protein